MRVLCCNEKGTFTVLVVSDPQCEEFFQWEEAGNELAQLVEKAAPDFVLINGDMESNCRITKEGWEIFIQPLLLHNIPWSTTNGNHDPFIPEIAQLYHSFPGCYNQLIEETDEYFEAERPQNYCLPVYAKDSDRVQFAVYGMDTGVMTEEGWDGLSEKQIAWYRRESDRLKEANDGKCVPALFCCHIPFAEVTKMEVMDGVINEAIGHTSIANDHGAFAAMKAQGDVKIAVFGHSHLMNQVGMYEGIILGFAGKLSTGSYHDELSRGGRVVRFSQEQPEKVCTYWLGTLPTSKDQKEVRV
ncbi:MAG: metallophosphoesterase [Clostridia bacterium]|nr:metallophosphoesterase [Clostridia bacterium]